MYLSVGFLDHGVYVSTNIVWVDDTPIEIESTGCCCLPNGWVARFVYTILLSIYRKTRETLNVITVNKESLWPAYLSY